MNYSGNVITKNPVQPSLTSAPGVWSLQEAQNAVANGTWPIPGVINPISRSLRFNSPDNAYLNRTPAVAGNRKTWTWSGWVKRGKLSTLQALETVQDGVSEDSFAFLSGDILRVYMSPVGGNGTVTDAVFRDPSAWYHIVIAVDTTQATAANRTIIYVNGVNVTSSSSNYVNQNADTRFNGVLPHFLGRYANQVQPEGNFDGYMTELNFIDGQALTPSSFGLTDPNTGVWVPKKYTGTYGTNGFYLNFSDSNSTTLLGYDYSGNGNNFTVNNFSVTVGAGNDSLTDVPTLWTPSTVTSDTGGVVRGNYCTWNPFLKYLYLVAPANGNLDAFGNNANWRSILGSIAATSGKWYAEITIQSAGGDMMVGVFNLNDSAEVYQICNTDNRNLGRTTAGYGYQNNGNKYSNSSGAAYGATYTTGDILGIALDLDGGTITFYKNGSSQGQAYSGLSGNFTFAVSGTTSTTYNGNFGQRPFAYTPPSGYKSLCTTNLPTPTIGAASTALAGNYFNPVLYTGTGSALGVTGVGFQPDFVWIKSRSASTDHALYDAVRGVQKQLETNNTGIETTETQGLTAFDTNGFNLGTLAQLNTASATYVGWNWKAGSSNVTNTNGSITSTVRANTTAGFSILTFTTPGGFTTGTVGHGLGVTPSMFIVKNTNDPGGTNRWLVYHISIGNTGALYMDTSNSTITSSSFWNNTSPTSSVFTVGANLYGSQSYVAYCFTPVAGYSAFGSYTGNGSTDGPFIYTGFRPAFILTKNITTAGYWWEMVDDQRSPYNTSNKTLYANVADTEYTSSGYDKDLVSNGFKIRGTSLGQNGNNDTYIYAAFAEFPFKFANAR